MTESSDGLKVLMTESSDGFESLMIESSDRPNASTTKNEAKNNKALKIFFFIF